MKRFVCLLCALLMLPFAARADSLKTRLEVPAAVSLPDFTTAAGESVITIDAIVEMPDVDTAYVYRVTPNVIEEERLKAVGEALGFEKELREYHQGQKESEESSIWKEFEEHHYNWAKDEDTAYGYRDEDTIELSLVNTWWRGKPHDACMRYTRYSRRNYPVTGILLPYAPDAELDTCVYTRDEARQLALDMAAMMAPDLSLQLEGSVEGTWRIFNLASNDEAFPDEALPTGYLYVFTREVDGIPVTVTSKWVGAGKNDDAYMPWCAEERLTVTVSDEGVYEVCYRTPHIVGERLEAPDEFIPFQGILEIAQSILPLRLATIRAQKHLVIDRIAFGYARVQERYQPGVFRLVPAWDFFGYSGNPQLAESWLTIDACTGLVIDREYGY